VVASIHDGSLFARLKQYQEGGHLLGAGTPAGRDVAEDAVDGIVQGHAYALLNVAEEDGNQLVQLRNPWGNTEWTGQFGDAWMKAQGSTRLKKLLGWEDEDDGTFWMSFSDFGTRFSSLYICKLFKDIQHGGEWHHVYEHGSWRGDTAGGCPNFDWKHNNQYLLTVQRPTNLFAALSQQDRRGEGKGMYNIALHVLDKGGSKAETFGGLVGANPTYTNLRSVTSEVPRLEPGVYTIVPSTFDKGEEGSYQIEIYSSEPITFRLATDDDGWK